MACKQLAPLRWSLEAATVEIYDDSDDLWLMTYDCLYYSLLVFESCERHWCCEHGFTAYLREVWAVQVDLCLLA